MSVEKKPSQVLAADLRRHKIKDALLNWGRWCRGGWPPLDYTAPPTSRDYLPPNQTDKRHRGYDVDVVSAEAANTAIVNLALNGDTRSYQVIAAWWAHHRPAKQIAFDLHCSVATVYNYRLYAMDNFWGEYLKVKEENHKRARIYLTN